MSDEQDSNDRDRNAPDPIIRLRPGEEDFELASWDRGPLPRWTPRTHDEAPE